MKAVSEQDHLAFASNLGHRWNTRYFWPGGGVIAGSAAALKQNSKRD